MEGRDEHEDFFETGDDPTGMDRRDFIEATAAVSAGLLVGAAGMSSCPEIGHASTWAPASFPKLVLYNCRIFDGIHRQLQKDRLVVVQGGKIEAIEPMGDLSAFPAHKGVDLEGRTLLPGLIDNHVHITVPFMYDVNLRVLMQMNQQIIYNFRNCIMSGVTTVRDVGGFPGKILEFRAMARIIEMQDKIGSIEEGKDADVIAVRGDPLEDLRALDQVDMVMKGGVLVKTEGLESFEGRSDS
jgi:imidazolonepropionase-like amidohydrolase